MKQEVLNYESDIIQKQCHYSESNFRMQNAHNHRYSLWNLNALIEMYVNKMDYGIKWIGCDLTSHVLAFFYCMLVGCLNGVGNQSEDRNQGQDDLWMRFKYSLYQESKQGLSIAEQKIFVEHLGLIEDSRNIAEFLKKSSHLESILIKLFSHRCNQLVRKQLKPTSLKPSKMQQLQWYSALFPFNNFTLLNEKCSSLSINRQTFYILEEKDCFFVVEEIVDRLTSCRISEVSTRKKTKTEIYGGGLQYIDSLKSFEMLQTGYEATLDNKNKKKAMSNSQSKQLIQFTIQQRKQAKNQHSPLYRPQEQQRGMPSKSNFFIGKKKAVSGESLTKGNVSESKRDLGAERQERQDRQRKFQIQDLRTSVRDDKYYRIFGTPKIASERVSAQREEQSKTKTKKHAAKNYPIEMPQILQLQNTQQNRQNFIYQSLNPSQQLFQLKKQLTPKHVNRVPKFLIKKHEDPVPFTFSTSPVKPNPSPQPRNIKKQKSAVFSCQQLPNSMASSTNYQGRYHKY